MHFKSTLAALLAVAGLLAGAVAVTGAGAQPQQAITPAELGSQVGTLANAVAAQWAQHELADGALIDPVIGPLKGDYGDAMTGQAMVVAGLADDDEALVQGGIAAELAERGPPGRRRLRVAGPQRRLQRESTGARKGSGVDFGTRADRALPAPPQAFDL